MTSTGVRRRVSIGDGRLAVMAGVAGSVDAIGYVGFGRVFPANMTGNTVLLGLAAGQGHWVAAGRSALALGGFCAGLSVGATMTPPRRRGDGRVLGALGIEAAVLALLLVAWVLGTATTWRVVGAGIAMGLQSAATARVDSAGVQTTYVTGTLTKFVLRAVDAATRRRPASRRGVALPAAILVGYCLAALVTGAAFAVLREWTLLLPLAGLATTLGRPSVRPRTAVVRPSTRSPAPRRRRGSPQP